MNGTARLAGFVLLFVAARGLADGAETMTPPTPKADAEAASPAGEASSVPVPPVTVTDYLFVDGALPYVPASNTIATKLPLSLRKTPASVGVISEAVFEEKKARVLGDALGAISGLNVQTQTGIADLFVLRGMDSLSSGLFLFDGAPEPETSFFQLYNVERVEVLKGPASFLYGGSPTAGVVNLVRKQPEPLRFLSVSGTAGSFGTYDGSLDVNTASSDGRLALRLNGLYRKSDGYREGRDSRTWALNPSLTFTPNAQSSLNINVEYVDASFQPDAGIPVVFGLTGPSLADVPRRQSYQSPNDKSDQNITRVQADYQNRLDETLTLRAKAFYRRLDWDSRGTIFNGVFPGRLGLEVSRTLLLLDDRQEFYGVQAEAVLGLKTGPLSHRILVGVEAQRLADRYSLDVGFLPNIALVNPRETAQGPIFVLPQFASGADARSLILAPYAIDQIAVSDEVEVLLGGRFDAIDYDDSKTRTARNDRRGSPVVGLVYSPRKDLSLYGHYGSAFAPPSSRVVGERKPEVSRQGELGAKAALLNGRLQATLALYQLDRENVAIPDDNGITQQNGTQRSRGVEVELAAEPQPGLRALFSYAYNRATLTEFKESVFSFATGGNVVVDRSGNTAAFAPEHIANLWLSKRLPYGLGVAAGGRYLSRQFIAEDNLLSLKSALTFDAAVSYETGLHRVSLNFKNLTNQRYETRGFGSTSAIPASGFAMTLGYQLRTGF